MRNNGAERGSALHVARAARTSPQRLSAESRFRMRKNGTECSTALQPQVGRPHSPPSVIGWVGNQEEEKRRRGQD
jgi:hypothetical protein